MRMAAVCGLLLLLFAAPVQAQDRAPGFAHEVEAQVATVEGYRVWSDEADRQAFRLFMSFQQADSTDLDSIDAKTIDRIARLARRGPVQIAAVNTLRLLGPRALRAVPSLEQAIREECADVIGLPLEPPVTVAAHAVRAIESITGESRLGRRRGISQICAVYAARSR